MRPAALIALVGIVAILGGCGRGTPRAGVSSRLLDELLATELGGDTTRQVVNQNAFGLPAKGLSGADRTRFEVGDSFFTQNWVIAPASPATRDGLGPTMNATACAACHVRDGKARPFEEGFNEPGLLVRLSIGNDDRGRPIPHPVYGGQLQDRSIPGVPAEGSVEISRRVESGRFSDGSPWELVAPTYGIAQPAFGDPGEIQLSPRIATTMIGMGLLEAIPEEDIRRAADPDDHDGDGISGRVNEVWDAVAGRYGLGRFGWKANVPTVEQQVAGAFAGDIGITSRLHPDEDCPAVQTACAQAPTGGSPEIDDATLDAVVFYSRTLAVPAARDRDDPQVRRGAAVFAEVGCASCHTPTQRTGRSDIAVLSDQRIHPYTDLLLHDMGPGLADGRRDFAASGREWRTPPLWGIGLVQKINGHTRFLHDGRARSLLEAILWHGGEAQRSRDRVVELDRDRRQALIRFLESL